MNVLVAATGNLHKLDEISSMLKPLGYSVISKRIAGSMQDDPEETGDSFEENALIKARALADELGVSVIADDSGLEVDALNGRPGIYSARFAQVIKDEIPAFAGMTDVTAGMTDVTVGMTDVTAVSSSPAMTDATAVSSSPAMTDATAVASPPGMSFPRRRESLTDDLNCQCLLSQMKNIPDPKRTARFVCAIVMIRPGYADIIVRGVCEGKIAFEPSGHAGFGYDPVFIPDEQPGTELTFAELGQEKKDAISHRAKALEALTRVIAGTDSQSRV